MLVYVVLFRKKSTYIGPLDVNGCHLNPSLPRRPARKKSKKKALLDLAPFLKRGGVLLFWSVIVPNLRCYCRFFFSDGQAEQKLKILLMCNWPDRPSPNTMLQKKILEKIDEKDSFAVWTPFSQYYLTFCLPRITSRRSSTSGRASTTRYGQRCVFYLF